MPLAPCIRMPLLSSLCPCLLLSVIMHYMGFNLSLLKHMTFALFLKLPVVKQITKIVWLVLR